MQLLRRWLIIFSSSVQRRSSTAYLPLLPLLRQGTQPIFNLRQRFLGDGARCAGIPGARHVSSVDRVPCGWSV